MTGTSLVGLCAVGAALMVGMTTPRLPAQGAELTVMEPGTAVVDFRNTVLFATTAERRVYFSGQPLVGTNFAAQLYYGSNMSSLVAVTNPPARFRNVPITDGLAGTWVGGLRMLPGITPGSQIVLQVRFWDADWGETWESVISNKAFAVMSPTFTYDVPSPGAPMEAYYIEGFRAPFFDPCGGPRAGSLEIMEQPSDVTAPIGTTVILSVATTNACLFQWQFNGTNLPSALFHRLRINGVEPEHAGEYRVIVRGTVTPFAITSQVARVTVVAPTNEPPPAFRSQPESQIVWQGSNVTLTANVDSAQVFQWRFNGTNVVGLSRELVLTNVQPEQSGSYQLIAENSSGSVTSSVAGLTVIEPGAAVVDFRNDVFFTTTGERRVSFTSAFWQPVVGTNFAAQLFYGLSSFNLVAVTNPPARFRNVTTTDALAGTWSGGLRVLPGITPGSQVLLQVRFWGADWGETWESVTNGVYKGSSTTFTYDVPLPGATGEAYYIEGFRPPVILPCAGPTGGTPQFLEQPADVTAAIGTTVILSVATTNGCLFQWQFNGTNLPSALFQRLRINGVQPEHAGEYRLIARGTPPAGQPAYTTSRVARVTVVAPTNEPPPAFRSQPESQIVWQGSNVTLTANVEDARTFQWRFNGTNVVGLSRDLVLTNVQPEQRGSYQLIAENDSGSVTGAVAQLSVIEPGAAVVDFRNDVAFAFAAERRVFTNGGTWPLVGTNFAAQLYYGTNASNLVPVTNPPARFRDIPPTDPLAGTWVGGLRALPGVAPGSRVVMQVRMWDADFGETFELVRCPCKQAVGQVFSYDVPLAGAPNEAYYIEGFRSFHTLCGPPFGAPRIVEQPADVTAAVGTTVILTVNTTDACVLQWQFNGTNLPGARFILPWQFSPTPLPTDRSDELRINGVQRSHAGDYRVIVINSRSSVTSEVARLTVVAASPQFASPAWSPNVFRFHVADEDQREFVVETATNLASPVWSAVSTNVAPFWFTNGAPSVDRQRFYRSRLR